MVKDFWKIGFIAVPLLVASAPANATSPIDYLNVKGYTEFFTSPNSTRTFNYAGKPIYSSFPYPGAARIVFEELAKWAYKPTVQVTPRTYAENGMPNCGARLETEGLNLVAVVTCRIGRTPVAKPEFTLMIVDETSDAAYTLVRSCSNCTPTDTHNPWARIAAPAVRIERMNGRTGVFFKVDSKATLYQYTPPMALVTRFPQTRTARCFPSAAKANGRMSTESRSHATLPDPPRLRQIHNPRPIHRFTSCLSRVPHVPVSFLGQKTAATGSWRAKVA